MSEPIILNAHLKALPEVTAKNPSDYNVMITDTDGNPALTDLSLFTGYNTVKEYIPASNAWRWVTIARYSRTEPTGGLLLITSGNWSGEPHLHVFAFGSAFTSGDVNTLRPNINCLTGLTSRIRLRAVLIGSDIRIDAYSYSRKYWAQAIGNIPLVDIAEAAEPPADATVWQYIFTQSTTGGGGGNWLCFNAFHFNRASGERRAV